MTNIAALDLSSTDNIDLDACAEQFRQATQHCGFIYVRIGTDMDNAIKTIRQAQRLFFAQSPQCKQQISIDLNNRGYLASGKAHMSGARHPDQKEAFFWGPELKVDDPDLRAGVALCGMNQWPDNLPQFRNSVIEYSLHIQHIGDLLLQIVARSLNAPTCFFADYYQKPMLRGQLLRYPQTQQSEEHFGVAPHSDFGCITLLLQEQPGLEVLLPDGQWVAAPPVDRTLIVNIGDLLERWSNRRLPSTKHRVRNRSVDDRYSIAMFYDPSPAAIVDPQQLLPDETAIYEPVPAAEYILSRNRESFDQYKSTR